MVHYCYTSITHFGGSSSCQPSAAELPDADPLASRPGDLPLRPRPGSRGRIGHWWHHPCPGPTRRSPPDTWSWNTWTSSKGPKARSSVYLACIYENEIDMHSLEPDAHMLRNFGKWPSWGIVSEEFTQSALRYKWKERQTITINIWDERVKFEQAKGLDTPPKQLAGSPSGNHAMAMENSPFIHTINP